MMREFAPIGCTIAHSRLSPLHCVTLELKGVQTIELLHTSF